MTYVQGAALCHKLGVHQRPYWSATCTRCGAELSQAEVEEADNIRTALRDLEREDLESFGRYPDNEWDVRSHGGES